MVRVCSVCSDEIATASSGVFYKNMNNWNEPFFAPYADASDRTAYTGDSPAVCCCNPYAVGLTERGFPFLNERNPTPK